MTTMSAAQRATTDSVLHSKRGWSREKNATRDVDDYLRALRRASEVNAHVGDPDMPTHFAVLRWGRPDDAGSPRSARRAGVSDRGLESAPTRRRGALALPILST